MLIYGPTTKSLTVLLECDVSAIKFSVRDVIKRAYGRGWGGEVLEQKPGVGKPGLIHNTENKARSL